MLHTKPQGHWPFGSGEEDFLKGFYHIWAWRPSWTDHDYTISPPMSIKAQMRRINSPKININEKLLIVARLVWSASSRYTELINIFQSYATDCHRCLNLSKTNLRNKVASLTTRISRCRRQPMTDNIIGHRTDRNKTTIDFRRQSLDALTK